MTKATLPKNQQRTAVIYFGSERETYLQLVQAADSKAFLQFIKQPLQVQLGVETHKVNCPDRSRYTVLVLRLFEQTANTVFEHGVEPEANSHYLHLEWYGAQLDTRLGLVTATLVGEAATCSLVTAAIGAPELFESMVFGGKRDKECWRYATWGEAEAGHQKLVRELGGE